MGARRQRGWHQGGVIEPSRTLPLLLSSSATAGSRRGTVDEAELSNNKDIWSGLTLIGIGAAAIWSRAIIRSCTASRMGPEFFRVVLGGLLIVFGLTISPSACARARAWPGRGRCGR